MPDGSIDPGSLEGDQLTSWYLRSPAEIEQERQAAAAKRYQDFFNGPVGTDPDPGFAREIPAADHDVDPAFAVSLPSTSQDVDPGFTWAQVGPNRFRSVGLPDGAASVDALSLGSLSYDGAAPPGDPGGISQYQDAGSPAASVPEPDLTPQPVAPLLGELRGPPDLTYGSAQAAPAQGGPRASAYGRPARPPVAPVLTSAVSPGHQATPAPQPRANQTIAYGALHGPAPSDQELAELRRQQAAFAETKRKIDLQNSWFAVPALAPALVALGLGAAGEWATGEVAPEAEQAVANFVEREPYIRGGDTWATRAGRRAHAALRQQVAQKPGWDPEPTIKLDDGTIIRPDVRTPARIRGSKPEPEPFLMDLKPNTPSGLRAAARAVRKYEELTGFKTRPLLYDPKPFI